MSSFFYEPLSQTICRVSLALWKQVVFVVIVSVLLMSGRGVAYGQPGQCLPGGCNVGIAYGGTQTTTSGTFVNSLAITYAGEFNLYNVVAGNQYEWSLCTADGAVNPTPDMTLTLANDLTNAILCFSDNVCGLQPKILWTATITGVVRVYLHTPNCGTNTSSHTVRWRCAACAPIQPPANDLICNAQPISCGQTLAGSTINATDTGIAEGVANNCSGNNFSPGVWYVFSGNGQTVTASLCATIWDSWIQVYSGLDCNSINCVGGVDDGGPACLGSTSASISWNTTVGLNYYIFVAGFSTESAFNIALTCASTPPGVVVASDCANAVNICTNSSFQIDPNGSGNVIEFVSGSVSNPSINPASANSGCLLSGELNSTWMIVNIASTGTLEFSFGAPGGFGCLDWIMWPYNGATTCDQIIANQLPPIRCNWNFPCESFTGVATPLPALGQSGNFEPELNVTCGQRFLICLSNYSSQTTSVPLNFFGTATISCSTFTPITVNSPTICLGASATLTANGGDSYTWTPAAGLSATTGATVVATPSATTTYTVNGTGPCGAGNAVSTVTVDPIVAPTFSPVGPLCSGAALTLPAISLNGIEGTWSPAPNNTATTTYAFSPIVGSCATAANITVVIKPLPTAFASAPIVPVCVGTTVTLQAQTVAGATYSWTGPNGFTSTAQNPILSNVSLLAEGLYMLTVTLNGCSQSGNTYLNVDAPLPYVLQYEGAYCSTIEEGAPQNTWTGIGTYTSSPSGLFMDSETGIVDPSQSTPGTYVVTYTPLGCGQPQQTTVVVLPGIVVDGIYHD